MFKMIDDSSRDKYKEILEDTRIKSSLLNLIKKYENEVLFNKELYEKRKDNLFYLNGIDGLDRISNSSIDLERINSAIEYAFLKHDGQVRKTDNTPYILHPLRVSKYLYEHGASEDTIIAGILHDVVEDTSGSLQEITDIFGKRVSNIVRSHSENKDLSWEERKVHTHYEVSVGNIDVTMLILADKTDNLTSILKSIESNGDTAWEVFKRSKDSQEWYHRGIYTIASGVTPEIDVFLKEYKILLDKVFKYI